MEKLSNDLFKKMKKDEMKNIKGGTGAEEETTRVDWDGTGVIYTVTNPGPNAKVDITGEAA